MAPAKKQTDEGRPEGPVEDCVDYWIDGRTHVAQPQTDYHHMVRHLAVGTGGEQNVEDEKGRPTQDEREENQPQHFRSLLFVRHRISCHVFPLGTASQQSATPLNIHALFSNTTRYINKNVVNKKCRC